MSSLDSLSSLFSPSGMLMSSLTSHLQSKAMKKMDMDTDGSVSQSEFQAAMQKAAGKLGVELSGDDASQMFTGFDTDASGALDTAEVGGVVTGLLSTLGNAQSYMQSNGMGQSADDFATRDLDGDGMLSLSEFTGEAAQSGVARVTVTTQTIEVPLDASASQQSQAVTAADAGTGTVAGSTATNAASSVDTLMASLDTNQDGQISGDELTAFVSQIETVVQRYNDTALASSGSSTSSTQA